MQVAEQRALQRILSAYPLPKSGLVLYADTSGFTPGSAVIIDHVLATMVDGRIESIESEGPLNWNRLQSSELLNRLQQDVTRLYTSSRGSNATYPPYPYKYDTLQQSNMDGYATMAHVATVITAAILRGDKIIGHGLIKFLWQFLSLFIPGAHNSTAGFTTHDLRRCIYDTSFIEIAIQQDPAVIEDWMPDAGEEMANWQYRVGGMVSNKKWSLRTSMYQRYGIPASPEKSGYTSTDMMYALMYILNIWRTVCG